MLQLPSLESLLVSDSAGNIQPPATARNSMTASANLTLWDYPHHRATTDSRHQVLILSTSQL